MDSLKHKSPLCFLILLIDLSLICNSKQNKRSQNHEMLETRMNALLPCNEEAVSPRNEGIS